MKSIVAQEIAKMGAAVPFAFEVTFADGTIYRNRDEPARFALRFRNRAAEWSTAAFGHIGMIEKYIDGGIDVEGDLNAAFEAGLNGGVSSGAMREPSQPLARVPIRQPQHRAGKDQRAFSLWPGRRFLRLLAGRPYMMYTCAYWKPGTRRWRKPSAIRSSTCAAKFSSSPAKRWWTSAAASAASCCTHGSISACGYAA